MLTTKRDCMQGGARFALPTIGEIEGRLTTLEVVAECCIRELASSLPNIHMKSVRDAVSNELRRRCVDSKLCFDDTSAAIEYAQQLLDCAVAASQELEPELGSACVRREVRTQGRSKNRVEPRGKLPAH